MLLKELCSALTAHDVHIRVKCLLLFHQVTEDMPFSD